MWVEALIAANRTSIEYVGIESEAMRGRVSGLMNPFVRSKVKVMPRAELTKLAGTDRHQGIVGAADKPIFLRKCADPNCPGHAQASDFCEASRASFRIAR